MATFREKYHLFLEKRSHPRENTKSETLSQGWGSRLAGVSLQDEALYRRLAQEKYAF